MGPNATMIVVPVSGASAIRWGVEFSQQGDRLAHAFFIEDQVERRIVMRSVEGCDSERWPASAALQQMDSCASSPPRQGLAGVGSAGTAHWSLAVEEDDRGCLLFDVACRVKERFAFLGSTYDVLILTGRVEARPHEIAWNVPGGGAFFVRACDATSQIRWEESPRRWTIAPATSATVWPATVRWKYRIGYNRPTAAPP